MCKPKSPSPICQFIGEIDTVITDSEDSSSDDDLFEFDHDVRERIYESVYTDSSSSDDEMLEDNQNDYNVNNSSNNDSSDDVSINSYSSDSDSSNNENNNVALFLIQPFGPPDLETIYDYITNHYNHIEILK